MLGFNEFYYILIVILLITHVDEFEWSAVCWHLDTEEELDLAWEYVHGGTGCESADQGIRHEECKESEPEAT